MYWKRKRWPNPAVSAISLFSIGLMQNGGETHAAGVFSASGCTGFLTRSLEGSHYSDCVRNGVLSRYVLSIAQYTVNCLLFKNNKLRFVPSLLNSAQSVTLVLGENGVPKWHIIQYALIHYVLMHCDSWVHEVFNIPHFVFSVKCIIQIFKVHFFFFL